MREILVAIGIVSGLGGLAALPNVVAPNTLVLVGAELVVAGFVFGVPLSIYYHLKLWREVKGLPKTHVRWWIDPRPLHDALSPEKARWFTRLFTAGATGFGLCIIGAVLIAVGALHQ